MPQTVEVRFKGTRRDFFLWPDDQEPLRLREAVVVELERGQDLGRVHTAGDIAEKKCGGGCTGCAVGTGIEESRAGGRAVDAGEPDAAAAPAPRSSSNPALRPVLRRASQDDLRLANDLRRSEENIRRQVLEKVRQHQLDMKVSDAEWQWDKAKLSVYFTAEKRVDFRALVRDLAGMFRTRIELRQIGVRDEAARLTGVGRCGREYCCSTWLKDLSPVSLALAKDQHLSLNPAQISGGCGRLLCCLKYEHEFYVASRRRFPREGKALDTSLGKEKVVAVDIFRERVFLRSEEHGPRIIPLVQLKEETEAAVSSPALAKASAAPPRREPERRGPPDRGPRTAQRPDPRRDQPSQEPKAQPPRAETPARRPASAAASIEPPAHGADQQSSTEGGKRPRRRRRGRRGRGGKSGPGGPSTGSPPPQGPE